MTLDKTLTDEEIGKEMTARMRKCNDYITSASLNTYNNMVHTNLFV